MPSDIAELYQLFVSMEKVTSNPSGLKLQLIISF